MSPKPRTLRCAVYTRKSTDEGLEQDFNSLHAQREACEAYIASQRHEGWTLVKTAYDDGGFSGGSMERPGLKALLAAIAAKAIDVVVVYKVDRLTRSLTDFARIVDIFDGNGVSFVSVTQSFNTTTSMGRLTLNVLLSFAQFEREVTAERIRDKFAASKKKGIWMGGPVPLGYRVDSRKLVIVPEEAETVRTIYRRYLALGSFTALLDDLRTQGIVTKVSTLGDGRKRGGIPFARGALAYLLRNRVYIGELKHKTKSYPGEHEAILDRDLFDAVQAMRAEHCHEHYRARESPPALLRGLIVASDGVPYKPIGSKRGSARWFRYKRSSVPGASVAKGLPSSLAGAALDAHIAGLFNRQSANATDRSTIHHTDDDTVRRCVAQITVLGKQARITLTPEGQARCGTDTPILDLAPFIRTRRRRDVIGVNRMSRPIRAETRATLLETIAKARLWLDELASGRIASIEGLADREGQTPRQVTATLSCAFLAPDIVAAGIDGTLPDRIGAARVRDLPAEWTRQRQMLGLAFGGCSDLPVGVTL